MTPDWEFLVHWTGYTTDLDSWLHKEDFHSDSTIISDFWNTAVTDDGHEDYAFFIHQAYREECDEDYQPENSDNESGDDDDDDEEQSPPKKKRKKNPNSSKNDRKRAKLDKDDDAWLFSSPDVEDHSIFFFLFK